MNANLYRLVFDHSRGMCVATAECARAAGKAAAGGHRAAARPLVVWLALTAVAAAAQTLPTGGQVVRGAGSIQTQGSAMVVQQDTARLVTDWQSFSIGRGASVRFVQPSAGSVALNRVVGDNASAIFGNLSANGHVYLQNPNGVLFAPGARVDVGSLVATSLNADVDAFMTGHLRLEQGAAPAGRVVNQGTLKAAPGGLLLLAGPQVDNQGSMLAPGGTAALAAGRSVHVDATGAGLVSIQVPEAAVGAALTQRGRIVADGGTVSLQVAAADAARRVVMQVDGLVRARRVENRGGQIVLVGGDSGIVEAGGQLDAQGVRGAGGDVKVLGERVALLDGARLDASGAEGGGQVLVGGNYQGRGPAPNARAAYVAPGATLDASATRRGDGGEVVVWADGHTTYLGQARATGGPQGGDGGLVEVSGKQTLDFQGGADLRAPMGRRGQLLLDPATIEIGTVADVNDDATTGDDLDSALNPDRPNLFVDTFPGATSYITAAKVASLLASTDVSLQASDAVNVTAPLTVAPGGANSTLTLQAPSVSVGASMALQNASLAIGGLPSGGNPTASDSVSLAANVSTNHSVDITATNIYLNSGTLTADTVAMRSGGYGSVAQGAFQSIVANHVVAGEPAKAFNEVELIGVSNRIRALSLWVEPTEGPPGDATVFNALDNAFDLSGSATTLYVQSVSGITQSAPLVTNQLTVLVGDADPVTGAVRLDNPANQIDQLDFSVASSISVVTSGALDVVASPVPVTAGGAVHLVSGGLFTLAGDMAAPEIEIQGAGFQIPNPTHSLTLTGSGGRFLVTSTDFTLDDYGSTGFGSSSGEFNFVVFGGYTGSVPATGNGLVTNQAGTLQIDHADLGDVSRPYDRTTALSLTATGGAGATVGLESGTRLPALSVVESYEAALSGNFLTPTAGSNKGFDLLASNATTTTGGDGDSFSVTYYGLQIPAYSRPAGPGQVPAISEVTPLSLVVSGVAAVNKVYDATTVASLTGSATVTPLAGDTVTVGGTPVADFNDKNVGNGKPVTVTGYALAGGDAGNYTVVQPSGLSADITPATLVLSGLTAANKVYDATVAASLSGTASVSPLGDDVVVLSGSATGAFADKNVGSAKPVTVTGYTLGGADGGNYVVASNLFADITPLGLAIMGVTASGKVYDATTVAALLGTAGVAPLAGDTVTVGGTPVARFGDKNVGTGKSVTVTGYTLGGGDASNYTAIQPTGLVADITPLSLAVSGVAAANKVYDATTAASLTGSATVTPLAGDTVTVGGTPVADFNDKNVGNGKPVTVTGYALAGGDAGNYTVAQPSGLRADITPKALLPEGVVALNRVQNGGVDVEVDASSASLLGVLPGDRVLLDVVSAAGVVDSPDPGRNKPVTLIGFSLLGPDARNYSLATSPDVVGTTVWIQTPLEADFEGLRFNEYLQGVSDAQEPFRRAVAEALAAGFGKENIRKRLSQGLVFETGLAPPAIDDLQPAKAPPDCSANGAGDVAPLSCQ